ncbi:MAG: chloride channel protein, partial [Spirochaetales bacterium]|nr:chloride channel protein [Spirochaetales bacterium]
SSISADLVSRHFFGLRPVFDLHVQQVLPLDLYPYLLPLGVACGLLGVLFNLMLLGSQRLYGPLREELRPVAALLAAGVLGFVLPEILGGGHSLVERSAAGGFGLSLLIVLIAGKMLFTAASYGTGAPGGIFLPMLVIGALVGRLAAIALTAMGGVDPQFTVNFVILGMAAFFTAVVKAPITGAILISEMTGTLSHLLALIAVSAVAYAVAELLRSPPIYDALLARALQARGLTPPPGDEEKKVILTIPVRVGSSLEYRELRNLALPEDCFLIGIVRGAVEMLPRPRLEILPGDSLAVLTSEARAAQVKPVLLAMGAPVQAEDEEP